MVRSEPQSLQKNNKMAGHKSRGEAPTHPRWAGTGAGSGASAKNVRNWVHIPGLGWAATRRAAGSKREWHHCPPPVRRKRQRAGRNGVAMRERCTRPARWRLPTPGLRDASAAVPPRTPVPPGTPTAPGWDCMPALNSFGGSFLAWAPVPVQYFNMPGKRPGKRPARGFGCALGSLVRVLGHVVRVRG
eukprot:gene13690-biopygen9583